MRLKTRYYGALVDFVGMEFVGMEGNGLISPGSFYHGNLNSDFYM
jgi:hypothetical protein